MTVIKFIERLKEIINDLNKKNYNYLSNQDKALKSYIENLDLTLIKQKIDSAEISEEAFYRAIFFQINRLRKCLPERIEGGFFSYFIYGKSEGELYHKISELLNNIIVSDKYRDSFNIQKIITTGIESLCFNFSFLKINTELFTKINADQMTKLNLSAVQINGCHLGNLDNIQFRDFSIALGHFKNLIMLNLSHTLIGQRNKSDISFLSKNIYQLSQLKSLNLSYNNIEDAWLLYFFPNNNLSDLKTLKIYELDLSANFIHLFNFKIGEFDFDSLKSILDIFWENGSIIDLSCNYIDFCLLVPPLFKLMEKIFSSPRQIESLINPSYFISKENGVVVIQNIENHAILLVEKMDKDGQMSLMQYELINKDSIKIVAKLRKASDFEYYINSDKKNTFSDFLLVPINLIHKMEAEIIYHSQHPEKVAKYILSIDLGDSITNCYKYLLKLIKKYFDVDLYKPFIMAPNLAVNRVLKNTPYRFPLLFSNENSVPVNSCGNNLKSQGFFNEKNSASFGPANVKTMIDAKNGTETPRFMEFFRKREINPCYFEMGYKIFGFLSQREQGSLACVDKKTSEYAVQASNF